MTTTTTSTRPPQTTPPASLPPLPEDREERLLHRSPAAALATRLESAPLLEPLAEGLSGLIGRLLTAAGPKVTDALHGRQLGHALHPALTDLPIGLWAGSLLCDAAGDERGATLLGAATVASGAAAAATGWVDWSVTDGRERRLGLLHGLLNAGALALGAASVAARAAGGRRAARRLSLAGFAVAGGSAWIGGELVLGRGLMVDHTAWAAGPAEWTPALPAAELALDATRAVDVEGRRILLHRDGEGVHAMENACSHAGGPLCEGEIDGAEVVCPWHGSRFRLSDGAVVRGPATFPQLRLQARVRDGVVEVRGREG